MKKVRKPVRICVEASTLQPYCSFTFLVNSVKTLGETVILAEGTENEILAGSDEASGAPDRPSPPGADETGTRAFTFEAEAAAHLLDAGAVDVAAGAELAPRAGKASWLAVSTGSEAGC